MSDAVCGGCSTQPPRYRCPTCRVFRYCSVACYGAHKGTCAAPAGATEDAAARGDAAESVLLVKKRQRVGEEEVLHRVTPEALERVVELPRVRQVMAELARRKRRYAPTTEGDVEDESAPPDVLSTGVLLDAAQLEGASVVRSWADVVESICRHKYLEDQRQALMLYLDNDAQLAQWADEILRAVGARDEQGRFVLE